MGSQYFSISVRFARNKSMCSQNTEADFGGQILRDGVFCLRAGVKGH